MTTTEQPTEEDERAKLERDIRWSLEDMKAWAPRVVRGVDAIDLHVLYASESNDIHMLQMSHALIGCLQGELDALRRMVDRMNDTVCAVIAAVGSEDI